MDRRAFLKSGVVFGGLIAVSGLSIFSAEANENLAVTEGGELPFKKIVKTDAQWKRILTPDQYQVTRKAATESPYSSPLNGIKKRGVFACVCCSLPLFSSRTKFESNTGWPSFYAPLKAINVREKIDTTEAETRTEVLCNRCDAHLGHVFSDGPKPTGLRYCMNGVAMKFVKTA